MADPISIISIIGVAVSAVGSVVSGIQQSQAASYNAAVANQNAMIARNNAEYQAKQQERAARIRIGAAEANYGASGITTEGSPLDVLEESARNAELDAQVIKYQGQIRAAGYMDQAALDSARADSALEGGVFGAVGAVGKGASNFLTQNTGSAIPVNNAFLSPSYNPLAGGIPT